MEKYIKVYPWEVMKRIEQGQVVYMLDRQRADVYTFNSLTVSVGATILREKDEEGRYDFWCIEKGGSDGC
jgi:hypothetical protein